MHHSLRRSPCDLSTGVTVSARLAACDSSPVPSLPSCGATGTFRTGRRSQHFIRDAPAWTGHVPVWIRRAEGNGYQLAISVARYVGQCMCDNDVGSALVTNCHIFLCW